MGLHRFTDYLIRHQWQTLLFTFFVTFLPFGGGISIVIAALFVLSQEDEKGVLFTFAATLPYLVTIAFAYCFSFPLSTLVWAGILIAMLSNPLTYVLAILLKRKKSWSLLLQLTALFGVLIISIVHMAYPQVAEWWGTQLESSYQMTHAALKNVKNAPVVSKEMLTDYINITKNFVTGILVSSILFFAVIQLIVARWWQAAVFNPGNLRKELQDIRLTKLAGILFIASIVFVWLGNQLVLDIMPVLNLLFGAAGLSTMHYLFRQMNSKTAWFWLMMTYFAIIYTLPVSLFILALIALLDIWIDFRKRMNAFKA